MCGIAGSLNLHGRTSNPEGVAKMTSRLVHRGPDAFGSYSDGPVSLGHRRLSIIDLASGSQPMLSADGNTCITFNGEIYNFLELRKELEQSGHRFLTSSDTEVILHAYAEHGYSCLDRLRGMFAFAIWERRENRLFLARDRVGKKPVFYTEAGGHFVFASELHALLAHPGVSRSLDSHALDEYLTYGYIPAPRTIFSEIHKLPPAHFLVKEYGAVPGRYRTVVQRYWNLDYEPKLKLDQEQAAEGLLEVITDAVRLRLIADVPVGALLSGGLDSSVIVALMSRSSRQQVKTFSIGFKEADFNELPYARLVAQRYATDHHELVIEADIMQALPELVRHYGEPYADSSALPTYYVAKLTREHVTVALNGDGGDESLAGYERYWGTLLGDQYRRLPALLRRGIIEPAASLIPNRLPRSSRLRQGKRFLKAAGQPLDARYLQWNSYFDRARKQALYTPEFHSRLGNRRAEDWLLQKLAPVAGRATLDMLLAADVNSYLPFDLLVKVDIASMANSLEARSPFLDHKVMEYCARLPVEYKMRGRTLKYLLKRVASDLLPPQNIQRRKMGFGVPIGHWMKREHRQFVESTLLSPAALKRGYFRQEALRQLITEHIDATEDNSQQLWSLLWLELWHQMFVD
jgi:asparagine synthase (glutamine-hydrolysing)